MRRIKVSAAAARGKAASEEARRAANKRRADQEAAARAMLAALEWIKERAEAVDSEIVERCEAAIAQAEAAGIVAEE